MPTSFSGAAYVAAIQTLMDRQGVDVKVSGWTPGNIRDKFRAGAGNTYRPIAELMIEDCQLSATGGLRELDGELSAGLIVIQRLRDADSELDAFELALDVATALVDEIDLLEDPEAVPVFPGAPIQVTGVEPFALEGALEERAAAFLVRFEHSVRVRRMNQPSDPAQPVGLYAGRAPNVGADHIDDYVELVAPPEEPEP